MQAQGIVFGTEEYGPYSYYDKSKGQLNGLAVELVRAVLAEAKDSDSEIDIFPWPRLYKMAREQQNVAIFSIARTPDRESQFKWVGSLYKTESYLWKLKSRTDIQLSQVQDISKYLTIVTNKGIDELYFSSLPVNNQRYAVKSQQQRLLMVYLGRGDLFEDNRLSVQWEAQSQQLDFDKFEVALAQPIARVDLSLAFSKATKDEVVNKYRAALQRIKQNGSYQRIIAKWTK